MVAFSEVAQVHVCLSLTCKAAFDITAHQWSIYLAFAMCTFADILLTVGMCHLLYLGRTTFVE